MCEQRFCEQLAFPKVPWNCSSYEPSSMFSEAFLIKQVAPTLSMFKLMLWNSPRINYKSVSSGLYALARPLLRDRVKLLKLTLTPRKSAGVN